MHHEESVLSAITEEARRIPGHLGFYYKNLVTGLEYGFHAEEAFLAASVIKLPIYLHLLSRCARGELSLSQKLTVKDWEKMPGCGALSLFTGDVTTDLRSACRLMIAISDNTATNALIRLCSIPEINVGFREMGLAQTVLRRLLFDAEASAAGLENTISPKEMGALLEGLYDETILTPALCREAMDTLHLQQVEHKLNGKLCGIVPIAHKTGEDEMLSNDVGIVFAPQPFILCFAGHDTDVYRWEDLIRRAAWALYMAQAENSDIQAGDLP